MKAKIYSAEVNGTFTQVKAYKRVNAVARFKQLDSTINESDISWLKNATNSHQATIEDIYPEICK